MIQEGEGGRKNGAAVFTVVLPTRGEGRAPYFDQALQSVLQQTDPNWRLLVVDGGQSPLPLPDDARIQRLTLWPGQGIALALNRAMTTISTEYLAMLHDDDLLLPEALACLQQAQQTHPEADYFYSSRRFIDDQGGFLSEVYQAPSEVRAQDFLDTCPVKHLHAWRVKAALAIGGVDESVQLHGGDDYDFPWRMAEAGCRFQVIPQCLYLQRDHRSAERLTTDVPLDEQLQTLTRIFRKHGLSEDEIGQQLQRRKAGYLKQALFEDAADRERQQRQGLDRHSGWRELPLLR